MRVRLIFAQLSISDSKINMLLSIRKAVSFYMRVVCQIPSHGKVVRSVSL